MKHTKGKWEVTAINGRSIWTKSDPMTSQQICIVQNTDNDEQLSNAKLISKAPEMYEALKEELDFLTMLLNSCTIVGKDYLRINDRAGYLATLIKEIDTGR